jgi:hypothetical protein
MRDERSPEAMKRREEYRKSIGRNTVPPGSLAEQVKYGTAVTDMKMWPTPRTGGGSRPNQKGGKVLNEEVLIAEGLRERGKTLAQQQTESMWPTPTTKGFGHASEGQTMIMRRKVESGELTEKEAQAMLNGTTLRPPRLKEWMWPTPTNQEAGKGKFLETLVTKEGDPAKQGERAYNPKTGKHVQITLDRATQMWPTPRASAAMSEDVANIAKRGTDRGRLEERIVKMMPTPTRRDYKDSGKAVINSTRDSLLGVRVAKENTEQWVKGGGALNPTWVEWLMGYPEEYTVLKDWAILSSRKSSKKSVKR